MSKKSSNGYDIELPQSMIESFARFLIPIIKEHYIGQNKDGEDEENKDKTAEK